MHALCTEAPILAPDGFKDDTSFIEDLGSDSLQVLSLMLKAEECFGVSIAPGLMAAVRVRRASAS